MNINYIGQILSTTTLIFETDVNGKRQCFYVKAGDGIVLEENKLKFRDFIEDKEYTIDNNFTFIKLESKGDVLPSYIESAAYNEYIEEKKDQIIKNNKTLSLWFDELKSYYSFIDKNEENLFLFKTQTDTNTLEGINALRVTDLFGYINSSPAVISRIKDSCYILLKERALKSIEELELEKKKFEIEEDLDALEEIDLILDMINKTVEETSFESITNSKDIAKLWPPLLLPSPIDLCP